MIESHDYRLHLEGTSVKMGLLTDPDGTLEDLEVASPPEFGGPDGVWSPEHLFVASVSGCLMTTFRAIADLSKLEVVSYRDDAVGTLVRGEDRYYRIEKITLRPRIVIGEHASPERAHRLVEKAEQACLISRSVSSEIVVEPTVEVAAPVYNS